MVYQFGKRRLQLLKLIGAFIILGAALMLLSNVYKMIWIASIIDVVNHGGSKTVSMDLMGLTIVEQLKPADSGTQLGLLLVPIAGIMFWAAILIVGGIVYNTGLILPMALKPLKIRKKK